MTRGVYYVCIPRYCCVYWLELSKQWYTTDSKSVHDEDNQSDHDYDDDDNDDRAIGNVGGLENDTVGNEQDKEEDSDNQGERCHAHTSAPSNQEKTAQEEENLEWVKSDPQPSEETSKGKRCSPLEDMTVVDGFSGGEDYLRLLLQSLLAEHSQNCESVNRTVKNPHDGDDDDDVNDDSNYNQTSVAVGVAAADLKELREIKRQHE